MDFSKDYYKVLGIKDTAGSEQIRKAYRALALKYHPDKNKDDRVIAEHFHRIKEAYEILSDGMKKRQYDAVRHRKMYSPYSFAKDLDLGHDNRDYTKPPVPKKKKDPFIWLKPVLLILIAIIAVWIMMHLKR